MQDKFSCEIMRSLWHLSSVQCLRLHSLAYWFETYWKLLPYWCLLALFVDWWILLYRCKNFRVYLKNSMKLNYNLAKKLPFAATDFLKLAIKIAKIVEKKLAVQWEEMQGEDKKKVSGWKLWYCVRRNYIFNSNLKIVFINCPLRIF